MGLRDSSTQVMLNWMPFFAVLQTDLKTMLNSWLVRIWAVLLSGQSFIASSPDEATLAPDVIAGLLGLFTTVWSTVVIVFSSGAISSESGVVADSILSKSVRRSEYILAKLLARVSVVLSLFLLSTVPVTYIITQNAAGQVDAGGIIWAFVLVGLMLTLLTTLAIASSTLFNRTLVAVVVIWFVWYTAGAITSLLNATYLSPLAIVDSLPQLIAGDYETRQLMQSVAGGVGVMLAALGATLFYFTRKDV